MNWVLVSLPLLLLVVALWVALGLVIARMLCRVTDGITVTALSLPVGLLAHLLLVNALSYVVFLPVTVWLVLLIGLPLSLYVLSRKSLPPLVWEISLYKRLGLLALIIVIFGIFFYINAREIWGDDPGHATMTSILASGLFPPRFQCNPDFRLSYQYGGNLLGAAIVNIAGIAPWDAIDLVKAAQVTSVVMLAFLMGWRFSKRIAAGLLSAFMVLTVGSAMWFFLPLSSAGGAYLAQQTSELSRLPEAMQSLRQDIWSYSIVPPGFLTTPYVHTQRTVSWGFGIFQILLFAVLIETRIPHIRKSILLGVILGATGLIQPSNLFILLPGIATYIILLLVFRHRIPKPDFSLFIMLGVSLLLVATQGGVVTDMLFNLLDGIQSSTESFAFVSLRFPSCLGQEPSAYCGLLTLGNLGFVPLFIPLLFWLAVRKYRNPAWIIVVSGCTWGIILPMFLKYGYTDWNIVRVATFSNWVLTVYISLYLFDRFIHKKLMGRVIIGGIIFAMTYTGILATWLIFDGHQIRDSATIDFRPPAEISNELLRLSQIVHLPLDAIVFEPIGCGVVTEQPISMMLGRYTKSSISRGDYLAHLPEYDTLREIPRDDLLLENGYTHVYLDHAWYQSLAPAAQNNILLGSFDSLGFVGNQDRFIGLLRVCTADENCQLDGAGMLPALPYPYIAEYSGGQTSYRVNYALNIPRNDRIVVSFLAKKMFDTTGDYLFRLTNQQTGEQKIYSSLLDTDTYQVENRVLRIPDQMRIQNEGSYELALLLPEGVTVEGDDNALVLANRIKVVDRNFGDQIRLSGYMLAQQGNHILVGLYAEAITDIATQYHYSLILTNQESGEQYKLDGSPELITQRWETNQPYTIAESRFGQIPMGVYDLSVVWYNYFSPVYEQLQVYDPQGNATGQSELVLFHSIMIEHETPGINGKH